MDWLRAKVVFIVAFLLLDAFLAWEVSRLSLPVLYLSAGPAQAAQVPSAEPSGGRPGVYVLGPLQTPGPSPQGAPGLQVVTVGVDPRALTLLGSAYTCAAAGPLGPLYSSDCRNAAGAEVRQLGGALVYTAPAAPAVATGTPRALADAIVRAVDPEGVAYAGATASATSTTEKYVETYDGLPLFDGAWTVAAGPTGVTAKRFWLRVVPGRGAPLPVITAAQAVSAVGAAYGAGPRHPLVLRGPLLFGYYYPLLQPPALPPAGGGQPIPRVWQLVPVWRVRLGTGGCVYINAYSGQPEQAPSQAALRPVAC